ncbi:AEC family transporter [Roseomonas sp. USHLN139]|uniref:AEC family transporter n=1 Tax=Roseomonas sp. USHLN139 TaxID=3081298 RepID=UPI003B02CC89
MLTASAAVLPVVLVTAVGYVAGRLGWLGQAASKELIRFVAWLGLPAILFGAMARANWAVLWQPGFIAAFSLGGLAILFGTVLWRRRRGDGLGQAALNGLNASSANIGYVGFPIAEAVFGRESFGMVSIAAVLTDTLIFPAALILLEAARQPGVCARLCGGRSASPCCGTPWSPRPSSAPGGGARDPPVCIGCDSRRHRLAWRQARARWWRSAFSSQPLPRRHRQPIVSGLITIALCDLPSQAMGVLLLMAAVPTARAFFTAADGYRIGLVTTSRTIPISTPLPGQHELAFDAAKALGQALKIRVIEVTQLIVARKTLIWRVETVQSNESITPCRPAPQRRLLRVWRRS